MPRIEEVPWHQLHHAYGTCELFPKVLESLASADAKDRSWALNWLEELMYHQGTHYASNEYAVPFLLQTAAMPMLPDRAAFLAFLNRFLARGHPPLSPFQREKHNRKLQARLRYGFGDGSEHWRDYRRRSEAAAWGCRELLVAVVRDDPAPGARCWAIFQLAELAKTGRRDGGGWTEEKPTSWFSPKAALGILELFRTHAASDPHVAVRVSAAFGIGFMRNEPDAAGALREIYSQTRDPAVRVAAAAARHVAEKSLAREVTACVVDGVAKNLLPGLRVACWAYPGMGSWLVAAYANLGLSLGDGDTRAGSERRSSLFACVPFPPLPAWLNASLTDGLPLAELVEQSLERATSTEQMRAVRFLGRIKLGLPELGETLRRLLKHRQPDVRMAAAVALRRNNRKSGVAPILAVFRAPLRSRNPGLRRRAVNGLLSMWSPGRGGPVPKSVPMVVKAAEGEMDREVRRAMCKLFQRAPIEGESKHGAYRHAFLILTGWLGDPDLRADALPAMRETRGKNPPTAALDPLLTLLKSDAPERRHVPAILERMRSEKVVPALVDALRRETDPDLRWSIHWALQRVPKSASAAAAVLAAVRSDELSVDGIIGQFLALACPKSIDVLDVLLPHLQSSGTRDRQKLAEAVGYLKAAPQRVCDGLVQTALTDPDGPVRAAAAKALVCAKQIPAKIMLPGARLIAERGDDEALRGLLELLDHGNTPVLRGLARSLLPTLERPNYWLREKAVSALARMEPKDADVERAVLRRLDDEQTTVRREAAKYPFERLPADEVCPPLVRALRDENAEIWAWWNLRGGPGQRAAPRAPLEVLLPAAEQLLRSPGNLTVNDVCGWLKTQGPAVAAAVPRLLQVIDDPSPKSRFAKIEALLSIAPSQTAAALKALEPLLSHELDAVREAATEMRRRILDTEKG
jgi:HEAT repeat protein